MKLLLMILVVVTLSQASTIRCISHYENISDSAKNLYMVHSDVSGETFIDKENYIIDKRTGVIRTVFHNIVYTDNIFVPNTVGSVSMILDFNIKANTFKIVSHDLHECEGEQRIFPNDVDGVWQPLQKGSIQSKILNVIQGKKRN